MGDDLSRQCREVDSALPFGAQVAMVVAQLVETAEGQVERRPVERSLLAPELVEEALEVMRQPIDRLEPHDDRSALDAVEHPERFLQRLGVGRVLLQPQQRVVERGDMLVGLIEVERQQLGQVEARHRVSTPAA